MLVLILIDVQYSWKALVPMVKTIMCSKKNTPPPPPPPQKIKKHRNLGNFNPRFLIVYSSKMETKLIILILIGKNFFKEI